MQPTFLRTRNLTALAMTLLALSANAADPLPSWHDREAKRSIIAFVEVVTSPCSKCCSIYALTDLRHTIVSGGGIEFMRAFAEDVYGIPPQQVIGSSIVTKYELRDRTPVLVRMPEVNFVDDKAGKPVAINQHIGRRPIAAFGNSDGDLQMLQWTAAGETASLQVIVRHTDESREWAYDRGSHIGGLDVALDEAITNDWLIIDMKDDWNAMYPATTKR